MATKFEVSKTEGFHAELGKLVGKWDGVAKTWFEPNKVADESPITGEMRLVLGGKFILHEYQGKFGEQLIEGMAIYGYDLTLNKFQGAWIDSFHTGTSIMFSEGKRGDKKLHLLGSYAYVTPESEQQWGWRTHLEIVSEDKIIITAYNISPDQQEESKATEIVYQKVR